MTCEQAIELDRSGQLLQAWHAYAHCLGTSPTEPALEVLMDAAILCWQLTDPGVGAGNGLSARQLGLAEQNYVSWLQKAKELYPASSEPRLWERFTRWLSLGDEFDVDECCALLQRDPSNAVPYLFLYMSRELDRDSPQVRELESQCENSGTSRSRYILSVLRWCPTVACCGGLPPNSARAIGGQGLLPRRRRSGRDSRKVQQGQPEEGD